MIITVRKEPTVNYETKALEATIALHNEIKNSDAFAGYDGDIIAFNSLYKEVYAIVANELPDDADIDQVFETFYQYDMEISQGLREVDWAEYV